MPKRIYVGNLPPDATEREVQSLFQGAKVRSIHLNAENKTQISAIVILEDDHIANRYLSTLRGKIFKDRKLTVRS